MIKAVQENDDLWTIWTIGRGKVILDAEVRRQIVESDDRSTYYEKWIVICPDPITCVWDDFMEFETIEEVFNFMGIRKNNLKISNIEEL